MTVRKRLGVDGPGVEFVTTTVSGWTPVFRSARLSVVMIEQFVETLVHFRISCLAYVLMPSHLHALLGFRDLGLLPKFMQSLKILSSKRLKPLIPASLIGRFGDGDGFRLWKPRYDDVLIVSEKQFRVKLNYIHNNPVKGGLAAEPDDWRYSSARFWLRGEPGPVPIDRDYSFLA